MHVLSTNYISFIKKNIYVNSPTVLVLFPNSPFLFGGGSGNETTTAQDMFGQYQASSAMLHMYNLFLKAVADSS